MTTDQIDDYLFKNIIPPKHLSNGSLRIVSPAVRQPDKEIYWIDYLEVSFNTSDPSLPAPPTPPIFTTIASYPLKKSLLPKLTREKLTDMMAFWIGLLS